ncbi:MAG: glutamine-synthetase adenylyltransferase, partial [Paracoccaceae bacterium]
EAKPAKGSWEAKNGPGRLMDIELMAQMACLIAGSPLRRVEQQIAAGVKAGELSRTEADMLLETYRLCWRMQAGSRLLSDQALDVAHLGEGARAFLLRETQEPDAAALSARLETAAAAASAVIAAHMG